MMFLHNRRFTGLALVAWLFLGDVAAVFALEADWASAINKAKFSELKGNFDDAETQLRDSLERSKTVPDKRAAMFSNLELGDLYADWNKPGKAGTFYDQAVESAKADGRSSEVYALHAAAEHCKKAGFAELANRYRENYDRVYQTTAALPSLDDYMPTLRQQIRTRWLPGTRDRENVATVLFVMSPDGKPQLLHLQRSSGDEDEDARALSAIANAAPYQQLPQGAPRSGIAMEYSFDYRPAPQFSKAPAVTPSQRKRYRREQNN